MQKLEHTHHEAFFIPSEAQGLTYVTMEDDYRVMLIVDNGKQRQTCILDIAQVYALSKEIIDILPFVGRSREAQYNWTKQEDGERLI